MEIFDEYGYYWLWLGVSLVLLVLEVILGSFRYLAASVAAVALGGLSYFYPDVGLAVQCLFFGVFAAGFIWFSNSYLDDRVSKIEALHAMVKNKAYVGRELKLSSGINNGYTSVNIDGVVWQVLGDDCEAGTRVKVVDMAQAQLMVELIDANDEALVKAA